MRYTKTRPVTQKEFDTIHSSLQGDYKMAVSEIYKYGKSLTEICNKYNFNRKNLQNRLKNFNCSYMCLREGFISRKLSMGFTMESIRNELGMSIRSDLNSMMWEKIRGDIRPSIRWKILKRDNFRCVLCGADATDRKLHIDHIIPVSKGGISVIKNLRVLCSQCNTGRNTDLKDFKNTSKTEENKGI